MSTSKSPRPPTRGVIWHFTDLHFHPTPAAVREDAKARAHGRANFEDDPFRELLKYAGEADDLKADFLVFSGDHVEAGSLSPGTEGGVSPDDVARGTARRAAFENARDFIIAMAKAHGLHREMHERVIVCPGNHDVDWTAAARKDGQPLTDYLAVFGEFVGQRRERPFTRPGTQGICILPLDTTQLGGVPFYNITDKPVQLDAGAYIPAELNRALGALKSEVGGAVACPEGVLGIVVSHHPPTVTPTREVEVKPFEIAIGAGQAKYRLYDEGFRIFLNGHKHAAVAHHESFYPWLSPAAEGMVILTGAPFLAEGRAGRGFNVLEYAVSPDSGEARVLVYTHQLDGHTPRRQPPRRFYIAPRRVRPAAVLRLAQRIGVTGDARADYEYKGVPLPSGDELTGWTAKGEKWSRHFVRVESADQDTASPPLVAPLMKGVEVTADVAESEMTKANRRFEIEVVVDQNTPLESVSFVERVFNYGAFAVSKGHQRRVCGDQKNVCPGVEKGWEGVFQMVREPVQRLEFAIHLPFALSRDYPVKVETWTWDEAGTPVRAPHLLRFSPHRVETNFKAKRISVTVDEPIVGTGYSVRWELPNNDPALGEDRPSDQAYERTITWAMRFQAKVLRFDDKDHSVIGEALRKLMKDQIDEMTGGGVAAPDEEIEWALFVPRRVNADNSVTTNEDGRPLLTPAFASYGPKDTQWMDWPAGVGVVGRAYALNNQVEAIRPESERYVPPPQDEWINPLMAVYEPKPGSLNHTVLYGIPVHMPERPDIVWGVLAIGTAREYSEFDLNKPLQIAAAPGAPPVPAIHVLMRSLTDEFSRKLARFMKLGTPFAEPLAGPKPQQEKENGADATLDTRR